MNKLSNLFFRIVREKGGQDFIEYALLVGLFGLTAVAAFPPVANNFSTIFSRVTSTAIRAGG